MFFDTLYINANIITMDPSLPKAKWVAVSKGKIAAIGNENPPLHQAAKTIDLEGLTMLPGLIDSHAHGTITGFSLNSTNVGEASCVADVIDLMEERCKDDDSDCWIFGSALNIFTLKEERPPTRWELDAVSGEHPVLITNVTLHGSVVNTKAMELLNIPSDMPGVEKDENGVPNGAYTSDETSFLATGKALGFLDDDVIAKYIKDCVAYAASQGVTTLHSLDGQFVEDDRDFYIWLNLKDQLPIHVVNYFQNTNINLVKALGLPRIGGCLTLDGAGFEKTMAIEEPYNHDPSTNGVLYWTDEEVYRFVSASNKAGLQCAMHTLGDRAIEQLLNAHARVAKEQENKGLRHRIEHFAMAHPRHIKLAVELEMALPMQPIFTYLWDNPNIEGGDTYSYLLGKKRSDAIDPFPAIIDAGGVISGGSDSPVTPINPLMGIYAAAQAPNPVRRVPAYEALKMFTINGAWAAHEEDIKGSIEINKLADFTIIDGDPLTEPERIKDFNVIMTIVEDKAIYNRSK